MIVRLSLLAAALTIAAVPAYAKSWNIDYDKSEVGFIGKQGSSAFAGTFKQFEATVDLDPEHPESGKIAATIETGSATTAELVATTDYYGSSSISQYSQSCQLSCR